MDVREKLVELLKEVVAIQQCGFGDPRPTYETVARYLISHGVTVQEWISVDDRLPEKDGAYLTTLKHFGRYSGVYIRCFSKDGEMVDEYKLAGQKCVWYFYDSEYGYISTDYVTHWMPLPEKPKGE